MLRRSFKPVSFVLAIVLGGACVCGGSLQADDSDYPIDDGSATDVDPNTINPQDPNLIPGQFPVYPNGQVNPQFGPNPQQGAVIAGQVVGGLLNHMMLKQQAKMQREQMAANQRMLQMNLDSQRQLEEMRIRAEQEANKAAAAAAEKPPKEKKPRKGGSKSKPKTGGSATKPGFVLPGGVPFPAPPKPRVPKFGF